MQHESLSPEAREKALACKTPEELFDHPRNERTQSFLNKVLEV